VALCVDQGGIPPFQFNLTDGTNEYTPYATKGENCALYKLQVRTPIAFHSTRMVSLSLSSGAFLRGGARH
jgi:hypothetical protein